MVAGGRFLSWLSHKKPQLVRLAILAGVLVVSVGIVGSLRTSESGFSLVTRDLVKPADDTVVLKNTVPEISSEDESGEGEGEGENANGHGDEMPEFKSQQEREAWCMNRFGKDNFIIVSAHATDFYPTFRIALYRDDDIVSRSIRVDGTWEGVEARELFTFYSNPKSMEGKVFLDIGANIGWFTMIALAKGYRVVSFEPDLANQQLIQLSVCINPGFSNRLALYAYGLSENEQTCYIMSDTHNMGDGHTVCTEEEKNSFLSATDITYTVRSESRFVRLDDILEEGKIGGEPIPAIGAMKIDIEGYEKFALAEGGAGRLFKDVQRRPPVIAAELYNCQGKHCNEDRPYVEMMFKRGYGALRSPMRMNENWDGSSVHINPITEFDELVKGDPINIVYMDLEQVDVKVV